MTKLPINDWSVALDRMTAALGQSLKDLDRYEAEWAAATSSPAAANHPDLLLSWLENRLAEWDGRLNTAAELAESVKTQLAEQEGAMGSFQELIKQTLDISRPTSG